MKLAASLLALAAIGVSASSSSSPQIHQEPRKSPRLAPGAFGKPRSGETRPNVPGQRFFDLAFLAALEATDFTVAAFCSTVFSTVS